ncbi:MAG: hypothetical protein V3R83_12370 [Gammaproteobacteria bacterium]
MVSGMELDARVRDDATLLILAAQSINLIVGHGTKLITHAEVPQARQFQDGSGGEVSEPMLREQITWEGRGGDFDRGRFALGTGEVLGDGAIGVYTQGLDFGDSGEFFAVGGCEDGPRH